MTVFIFTSSVLALFVLCSATQLPQEPELHSCSEVKGVQLKKLLIMDPALGLRIKFNYTVKVKREFGDDPTLKISLSRNDNGLQIPCVDQELGSCTYHLCKYGAPVFDEPDYDCPIKPKTYTGYKEVHLPFNLPFKYIGDKGLIDIRLTAINDGKIVGCSEAVVRIYHSGYHIPS